LYIRGLLTPSNDIYNSTGSTILATNQSEYNVTLSPGDVIYVADYTSALNFSVLAPDAITRDTNIPFSFSAVSNNGVSVSTYYYSYGGVNYTSPGSFAVSSPGDYTFTLYAIDDIGSAASYVLTTNVPATSSYMSDTSDSLLTIVGFVGLLVAVLFSGLILGMIRNDSFDAETMKNAVYIIVISMIVLGVGLLIFSVFSQIP
jgi:hypothetical protein